ncbi:hypothetical protein O9992_11145 [Vibrio lentus]|nr:hypothetical protein [Vibrio lentus]
MARLFRRQKALNTPLRMRLSPALSSKAANAFWEFGGASCGIEIVPEALTSVEKMPNADILWSSCAGSDLHRSDCDSGTRARR